MEKLLHCRCKRGGRCPSIYLDGKDFVLGGKEEGFTRFSLDNFRVLVEAAKSGKFDTLLEGK